MSDTLISKLNKQIKHLEEQKSNILKKIEASRANVVMQDSLIKQAKEKIEKLKSSVEISEHAYLRYLTRIKGLDLDQIKEEMLGLNGEDQIKALSTGTFPVGDSHTMIVKDNKVITIINQEKN